MNAAWSDVEAALDGILARRWYTNHGPLAKRLEAECAEAAGRRFAIAVTNPTIGLVMLADALALSGDVLLSPLAPPRDAQSLQWAGLRPRFCDIDPETLGLDPNAVTRAISSSTTALLASPGADHALAAIAAEHGLHFYRDAVAGTAGPELIDLPAIGADAGTACILTDDEHLAARLRNIRSSYGAGAPVPVLRTANGRISEAQAAIALLVPSKQRIQRPDPVPPPHCKALTFGQQILLIAANEAVLTETRAQLAEVGAPHAPLRLDPRAEDCPEAARIAALAVVVDAKTASAPIWN